MMMDAAQEDALRKAFAEYAQDRTEQFRLKVRRDRAKFIRELMSGDALDVDTFNREVWTSESEAKLDGVSIKGVIPPLKPIDNDLLNRLERALGTDQLELHGNYSWGSGTKIYGPQISDKDSLLTNLHTASQILKSSDPPIEKTKRLIQKVKGFGPNVSSGLVMMFHPEKFAIYNQASQDATRLLGFPTDSLESFQEVVTQLKEMLGCADYLELDWFLYLVLEGRYPDAFPFTSNIRAWQPEHCPQERIRYREEKEKQALRILKENAGSLTEEQFVQVLNLLNMDFYKGREVSGRFGQAIVGNNRNQMLTHLDEMNKWIRQFLEVSAPEVASLMTEFLKSSPSGAGRVIASLILYTRDSSGYCVWVPAMVEGLQKLTHGYFPEKSGNSYLRFNDEVQRLRKLLGLAPQEPDILLCLRDGPPPPPTPPPPTEKEQTRDPAPFYSLTEFASETYLDRDEIEQWVKAILRKKQGIFYGPPGTGKTYVAQRFARHLVGGGDGFAEILQFHPAYAYEDFVQGLRPTVLRGGGLEYKMIPGRFKDFCSRAADCEGKCVLIIDEINRANLSRVLGELMFLLEYRGEKIPLAGGEPFRIPGNVYLIGTMNTADRSIALVDHALRRRFAFMALYPNYDILKKYHESRGFNPEGLISVLGKINSAINDRHYSVGVSFFLDDNIRENIQGVWKMEIEPYIEEIFFDQPEKATNFSWEKVREAILGT
ncbi:MAG: McrB family protein [Syntrophales bacterium]